LFASNISELLETCLSLSGFFNGFVEMGSVFVLIVWEKNLDEDLSAVQNVSPRSYNGTLSDLPLAHAAAAANI